MGEPRIRHRETGHEGFQDIAGDAGIPPVTLHSRSTFRHHVEAAIRAPARR
jgi:hypothetical protein